MNSSRRYPRPVWWRSAALLTCALLAWAGEARPPAIPIDVPDGTVTIVPTGVPVRLDAGSSASVRWRRAPIADLEDAWEQFAGPESYDHHAPFLEVWRGWVVPPVSGTYVFVLSAQDQADLWLGTSADPASRRLLVRLDRPTPARAWDAVTRDQCSPPVALEKGRAYWIEASHRKNRWQDGPVADQHLAVAWVKPIPPPSPNRSAMETATRIPEIIPGSCLSPWDKRWDQTTLTGTLRSLSARAMRQAPPSRPPLVPHATGCISRALLWDAEAIRSPLALSGSPGVGRDGFGRLAEGVLQDDGSRIATYTPLKPGEHRLEVTVGTAGETRTIVLHAFNRLANQDFAVGSKDRPDGWRVEVLSGKAEVAWDPKGGMEKDGAVRITGEQAVVHLSQQVTLCPNTRYLIRLRAKLAGVVRSPGSGENPGLCLASSVSLGMRLTDGTDGTCDWKEFALDVTTGTWSDLTVICGLGWKDAPASGTVFIDRCTIEALPNMTRFESRHLVLNLKNDPQVKPTGPDGVAHCMMNTDRLLEHFTDLTGIYPRRGMKAGTDMGPGPGWGFSCDPVRMGMDPDRDWPRPGYLHGLFLHEFGHVWDYGNSQRGGIGGEGYAEYMRCWGYDLGLFDNENPLGRSPWDLGWGWNVRSGTPDQNFNLFRATFQFKAYIGLEPFRRYLRWLRQQPWPTGDEAHAKTIANAQMITRLSAFSGMNLWAMLSEEDRTLLLCGNAWGGNANKRYGVGKDILPAAPAPSAVPKDRATLRLMDATWDKADLPTGLPARWCLDPNGELLSITPLSFSKDPHVTRMPTAPPPALFAPPGSVYTYDLGGQWKRLTLSAAQHHARAGSMQVVILGDGRRLAGGTIDGAQTCPFTVPVEKVKTLVLHVAPVAAKQRYAMWIAPVLTR